MEEAFRIIRIMNAETGFWTDESIEKLNEMVDEVSYTFCTTEETGEPICVHCTANYISGIRALQLKGVDVCRILKSHTAS